MKAAAYQVLMGIFAVLALFWLAVVIPAGAVAIWLKKLYDWAEIGFMLAIAEQKTKEGRKP